MKKRQEYFWQILEKHDQDFPAAVKEMEEKMGKNVSDEDSWGVLNFASWRRIFFCAQKKELKKMAMQAMEIRARDFDHWTWVYLAAREMKDTMIAKYAKAMMVNLGDFEDWQRVLNHLDPAGQRFAKKIIKVDQPDQL